MIELSKIILAYINAIRSTGERGLANACGGGPNGYTPAGECNGPDCGPYGELNCPIGRGYGAGTGDYYNHGIFADDCINGRDCAGGLGCGADSLGCSHGGYAAFGRGHISSGCDDGFGAYSVLDGGCGAGNGCGGDSSLCGVMRMNSITGGCGNSCANALASTEGFGRTGGIGAGYGKASAAAFRSTDIYLKNRAFGSGGLGNDEFTHNYNKAGTTGFGPGGVGYGKKVWNGSTGYSGTTDPFALNAGMGVDANGVSGIAASAGTSASIAVGLSGLGNINGFFVNGDYLYVKSNDPFKNTSYSLPQTHRGHYKGQKYGISHSGESGVSFIFTEASKEGTIADYNRTLINSKSYLFTAGANITLKLNFVSTSKSYHPQFRLSERNADTNAIGKENYKEVTGLNKAYGTFASKFSVKKGIQYVIEIGGSEKLNTNPFDNINIGGFIASLSAGKKTLQETLAEEVYRVSMSGVPATVPTEQAKTLVFGAASVHGTSGTASIIEAGSLDYSLTPYFEPETGTITTYWRFKSFNSSEISSSPSARTASSIHFACSETSANGNIYEGVEAAPNFFDFVVPSRSACNIIVDLTA